MRAASTRRGFVAGAASVIAACAAGVEAFAQDEPHVRTLAGNGVAGNADGVGTAAEFMQPVAIAFDPKSGVAYVADRAGQRIRAIDSAGAVSTVAGGGELLPSGLAVKGDYRDGAAADARFDAPSGIAIGPDATVYVADAFNRRIRAIANGGVTTVPGTSLTEPRSIAVASDGTIYVADFRVGVCAVTKTGVTMLPIPAPYAGEVTDIALLDGPRPMLFGAVRPGVWRFDLRSHAFAIVTTSRRIPAAFAPYGVVALDSNSVIATSVIRDALFLATFPGYSGERDSRSLQIAGNEEKDESFAGGFRDDVAGRSAFSSPMGLAKDMTGNLLVADAGNRRIRIVPSTVITQARP